jgi:hypothetical protein
MIPTTHYPKSLSEEESTFLTRFSNAS